MIISCRAMKIRDRTAPLRRALLSCTATFTFRKPTLAGESVLFKHGAFSKSPPASSKHALSVYIAQATHGMLPQMLYPGRQQRIQAPWSTPSDVGPRCGPHQGDAKFQISRPSKVCLVSNINLKLNGSSIVFWISVHLRAASNLAQRAFLEAGSTSRPV